MRVVQMRYSAASTLDARSTPSCSTFSRPQGQHQGRDLQNVGQGHGRCRSRSLSCQCHWRHRLPRHATMSALCPPSCDVTSASPVDLEPLPAAAYDVNDDVRDSQPRTNQGRSTSDVSEMTWPDDPDVVYSATPTRLTTQYSLPRY